MILCFRGFIEDYRASKGVSLHQTPHNTRHHNQDGTRQGLIRPWASRGRATFLLKASRGAGVVVGGGWRGDVVGGRVDRGSGCGAGYAFKYVQRGVVNGNPIVFMQHHDGDRQSEVA